MLIDLLPGTVRGGVVGPMLIGPRAPHAPRRLRRWHLGVVFGRPEGGGAGGGTTLGFGATGAAPGTLQRSASRRAARRRMGRQLRQQRDLLTTSAAGRAAFDAALVDLGRLAPTAAWSYRVRADGLDLTFWIGAAPAS